LYDPIAARFNLDSGEIPIGKPLANVQAYILDPYLQPVPIGLPGELYIGGPGLARGYLNLPEQTASRFVPHPFSTDPTARLYKTGDTVRYLSDGTIEFVGRSDFQVKIRGFRIELGEIETVMEQHPALQQAIVIAHETTPGNKILVAYMLLRQPITTDELRQFLAQKLPDYMLPTLFVPLERLPLTANGKVDRRALPLPDITPPTVTATAPPQDDLEAQLIGLWQQVLGIPSLGINDNFFELGGHSLLAARLTDAVEQRFQKTLPATALFRAPTIAEFAPLLRDDTALVQLPWSAIVIQPGNPAVQPILFCIHVLGENCSFFRPLATHLGADYPVYGLAAHMMDKSKAPPNRVEAIAEFYIREMRTIQPEGPYHLTGLSFGGTVAFEMARQLVAQGQQVDLLALLDTFGPNLKESLLNADRIAQHLNYLMKTGPVYMLAKLQIRLESTKKKLLMQYAKLNQRLRRSLPYDLEALIVLQENLQASEAYVTKFYPGKVILFRAIENAIYSQAYLAAGLGWRDWVGELEIQDTPGTHMTMVEVPHVAVLATAFQNCLKPSAHLAEDG
jgi:thioesterase domain-containing protein/acyl carrier protein